MYFLPVRLKRIEADLVSVWQTASEGTGELYELDHQEEDAQDGVDLGDAGLPEGEVGRQVLSWNCEDLKQNSLSRKRIQTARCLPHHYPEDHRYFLLEVFLLTQPQSAALEATEEQQKEELIQESQAV